MKLTTHLHLASRLRMSGAIFLLPPCDLTAPTATTLPFSAFTLPLLWLVMNAIASIVTAVTMVTAVQSGTSASLHLTCSCIHRFVTADCEKSGTDYLGRPPMPWCSCQVSLKIIKLTFPADEPINTDVIVLTHSVASGCFSNENLCKERQSSNICTSGFRWVMSLGHKN